MAREQPEFRAPGRHDEIEVQRGADVTGGEGRSDGRSLGELVKQLTADSGELVRSELALAKAELRRTAATMARDAAKMGAAAGLGLAGVLALTAFLIAGLGGLMDGKYWLSALIVGVLYVAVAGVLSKNALADLKRHGLAPQKTVATLRDDAAWAKREAREVKRELTS